MSSIVLRPAMGSGTRWTIRWYIPVTSRSCSISRLTSSFTWGRTKPVFSHAVTVSVRLEEIFQVNDDSLCCRIPEKKNTDSLSVKQNLVHSGRSNMAPEQLKKIPLNGPLSSPQITKVQDHHYDQYKIALYSMLRIRLIICLLTNYTSSRWQTNVIQKCDSH